MEIKVGDEVLYCGTQTATLSGLTGTVKRAREDVVSGRMCHVQWSNGRTTEVYARNVRRRGAPAVAHGGKDDSGKANPGLLFEGCAPALAEVCKVLDGGAKKYAANSWQTVPNGIERYKAAFYRHLQDMQVHGWDSVNTDDFGLMHIDHLITDLLFIRTLMLKETK